MTITVKLYAGLADLTASKERRRTLKLPEGSTIADALNFLGIEKPLWAIMLVNGIHASPETKLQEGDLLTVFPPVAGG